MNTGNLAPTDAEDAVRLLRRLVGRTHSVITGVAVVDCADLRVWQCAVESEVTLRAAADAELRRYVATGEPLDKAGAYAIQGAGRRFMTLVEGSETNVIGLPIEETLALLPPSLRPLSVSAASAAPGENG